MVMKTGPLTESRQAAHKHNTSSVLSTGAAHSPLLPHRLLILLTLPYVEPCLVSLTTLTSAGHSFQKKPSIDAAPWEPGSSWSLYSATLFGDSQQAASPFWLYFLLLEIRVNRPTYQG